MRAVNCILNGGSEFGGGSIETVVFWEKVDGEAGNGEGTVSLEMMRELMI